MLKLKWLCANSKKLLANIEVVVTKVGPNKTPIICKHKRQYTACLLDALYSMSLSPDQGIKYLKRATEMAVQDGYLTELLIEIPTENTYLEVAISIDVTELGRILVTPVETLSEIQIAKTWIYFIISSLLKWQVIDLLPGKLDYTIKIDVA